jgi:hypothetical protein
MDSIEAQGAQLLDLPPTRRTSTPIEQAWSKIKLLVRAVKERALATLRLAMNVTLAAITDHDAFAWFHCGYGLG